MIFKFLVESYKKHPWVILWCIFWFSVGAYYKDIEAFIFAAYGILISYLYSGVIPEKLRAKVESLIWGACALIFALTIYVNYYLPHGPMIYTGEEECITPDKGGEQCRDEYFEDMRRLNIPDWAKFIREDWEKLLWSLFALGMAAQVGKKKDGHGGEQAG